jgi:uncharacterized protein (TIGR00369 family)
MTPNPMPLGELLGIEVESVEPDHATCLLTMTGAHVNQFNRVHSGSLFTLATTAVGFAANQGDRATWVGTSFSFNLYRSPRVGDQIRADARLEHSSRRIAGYQVRLERTSDATLIGTVSVQLVQLEDPSAAAPVL